MIDLGWIFRLYRAFLLHRNTCRGVLDQRTEGNGRAPHAGSCDAKDRLSGHALVLGYNSPFAFVFSVLLTLCYVLGLVLAFSGLYLFGLMVLFWALWGWFVLDVVGW